MPMELKDLNMFTSILMKQAMGDGTIDFAVDDMTSYSTQGAFDAVYDPQPSHSSTNGGDLTNDRINHIAKLDTTSYAIGRTIGAISDTAFVLRDHFRITANTKNGSGYSICPVISLSSLDNTNDDDTTMDSLSFVPYSDNLTRSYQITYGDGETPFNGNNTNFTETATVNDEFYKEHTRLSATSHKIELFTDAYSTSQESKTQSSIPSTIQGLTDYVIRNVNPSENQSGSMDTWWDDVGFQDGVTSWV